MSETIKPILFTRIPVLDTQLDALRTLLSSPGFSLLKEVVSAKCIEAQVDAMNARLYPSHDVAQTEATEKERKAADFSKCLEILDDLQEKEQEWFTAKLEHRR